MSDIQQEIDNEVTGLKGDITAALGELEGLPQDDPRYEPTFDRLVEASSALLDYEAEIPAKLQEPHRQASKRAIQWAARLHLAGAALLALTPVTGWISWWWLVIAVIQAAVAVLIGGTDPAPGTHRRSRYAAAALTAVTALVPLLISGVLPGWLWFAAIAGWVATFALTADQATPAGTAKRGRA